MPAAVAAVNPYPNLTLFRRMPVAREVVAMADLERTVKNTSLHLARKRPAAAVAAAADMAQVAAAAAALSSSAF